ncbi:MAG TPA: hypothetical protein VG034_24965 [Acidimicrobiia bacterium]|jgi:hypothetical protein|nr:hypothetical protein [Acidimicrobiia bacterium]
MIRRLATAGLTLALLGAACAGPNPDASAKGKVDETTTTTIAKGPETTASGLRSKLTGLFQEHVYLAAAVASSRGRPDESTAAQAALDGNSEALLANMTAVFTGDDAKVATQFAELWKGGVAQNAGSIGSLFSAALPSLPADSVSGPLSAAEQGVGNGTNFTALQAAASQMATMASKLVGGIAKKLPDKIGGDPASKAADLLASLNAGLREHVFLASAATGAALGGRADEFAAAKAALDANSDAVTSVITGVYGDEAGKQFSPLWKKHIDFLVDYTNAVVAKDQAKADKAIDNLLAYTEDFGAFINAASPKLTKDAVAGLIKTHVFTLKDVIDAQAAKNFTKAYNNERTAADHMAMIATGLATTVVAQFPTKF